LFRSSRILVMVVVLLLTTAVLFSMATANAHASRVVYHGYILKGAMPTKDQCVKYQKKYRGAERWRLWVRRYTYQQIQHKVAGNKMWVRVWNEDWVIKIIYRESRGVQNPPGWPCIGLMQINYQLHWPYSIKKLAIGWTNILAGAILFARPDGGPAHWRSNLPIPVSPYCPHI